MTEWWWIDYVVVIGGGVFVVVFHVCAIDTQLRPPNQPVSWSCRIRWLQHSPTIVLDIKPNCIRWGCSISGVLGNVDYIIIAITPRSTYFECLYVLGSNIWIIKNYLIIYDTWNHLTVCANGPEDRGSIPGWVIPKSQKMVLDAVLLNT